MITAEDILKIQSELTEEQFQKLVYYLTKDRLVELKELARKKCRTRFVRIMRKYVNKFIKELENTNKCKRNETVNLLNQTRKTLMNVHKLINNRDVVDANILLRSAFENLIMGMMINENEDTYKEFINLSINEKNRYYTKPQKLRNEFRKVLRSLDSDYFIKISNRNLKNMLDEFYDKMCMFAHSTLLVNVMVEIDDDKLLDLYIVSLKMNAYLVELLLYLCLKKICDCKKAPVDITYAVIGWFVIVSDVPHDQMTPEKTSKLNKLLYADYNDEYINKNKENVDYLLREAKQLQEDVQNNPMGVIELLEKVIE